MAEPTAARITTIDALRGFALAGVGLVHAMEQYTAAPPVEWVTQATAATPVDKILGGLNMMLLAGKFYLLFSLLFGLSFFIQIEKPLRQSQAYRAQFAWRLTILFAIGYLHHLIYRGDILMLYAALGITLLALHKLQDRWLILIAALLFCGLGRFLSLIFYDPDWWQMVAPESAENLAYFDTLKNGSLSDIIATNNIGGFTNLIPFQFGIFGRGYTTLGLFLIGIYLARQRILHNIHTHKPTIKRTLAWAAALTITMFGLMIGTFSLAPQPPTFTTWTEAVALTFYDLFNLAFATALACLFLLALQRPSGHKLSAAFAPYGRMALTNYLIQSLLGTWLFYGWGLGRLGQWPNRYLLLTGLSLIIAQMLLSHWWLRHFAYGPFEWLWRTLTLRKPVALRLPAAPAATY